MENLLFAFIFAPFLAFVLNAFTNSENEAGLAKITYWSMMVQVFLAFAITVGWTCLSFTEIFTSKLVLFRFEETEISLDLIYDSISCVYTGIGAFLAFLITAYARRYLHKEMGFKRFFNTFLLFYAGYNIIALSGNIMALMIGWEIAGIASFLLIAFYRDRFIPVKNGIKIFSVYRLADIALITALWLGHHIWHNSISLGGPNGAVMTVTENNLFYGNLFALSLVLAALIKSAQFPFSTWLPRAMEGPTPSSAIFYTSLSVHLGVLLLLRTYDLWSCFPIIVGVVVSIGTITFIFASATSRVQPSIKGQIAYACVAQIGLIFIEVALGWKFVALFHVAGNAFVRSYQLLISPSVVTYYIRDQFYNFSEKPVKPNFDFKDRIKLTFYVLSFRELNLDKMLYRVLWLNFQNLGKICNKLSYKICVGGIIFLFACTGIVAFQTITSYWFLSILGCVILFFAVFVALKAFVLKDDVYQPLVLTACSNALLACFCFLLTGTSWVVAIVFLSGILLSGFVASIVLRKMISKEKKINLKRYYGHSYEYGKFELIFLFASLGMFGFPVTSAYVGLEMMLSKIPLGSFLYFLLIMVLLFVNGIGMVRIYARIFLGPHVKTYHSMANRSA